jgi:hypothetical protein
MSGGWTVRLGGLAGALAVLATACGLPDARPLPRVVGASPTGAGVPPELDVAEVWFSEPVDPSSAVSAVRVVLAPAAALRAALAAVDADAGAESLPERVPAVVTLAEGGRRLVVRPTAPLHARASYALVLSSRLRAPDGRPVLDADGRSRPSVTAFETGAAAGPPPRPVVSEVRADAETPEAGGEYVELANRGEGTLDLTGFRLAKRSAAGALTSCALVPAPDERVAPGGRALVVGGAYDGRYATPAGTALVTCGASALLGGIANDRAPEILLVDPDGAVVSSLGAGGVAPGCAFAVERIDDDAPDGPENLACALDEGTPGECNSVAACD